MYKWEDYGVLSKKANNKRIKYGLTIYKLLDCNYYEVAGGWYNIICRSIEELNRVLCNF